MAITLEEVKNYLRVDFDLEDQFLTTAMMAARGYLAFAVDDLEEKATADENFAKLADTAQMLITAHYYMHRDIDDNVTFSMFLRSIIVQLQNFER